MHRIDEVKMKALKKLFLILLATVAALAALGSVGAFAAGDDFSYGRGTLKQMNNSEGLLYAYDAIKASCSTDMPSEITLETLDKKINVNELKTVVEAFMSDHPECFWLKGGYNYTIYTFDNTVKTVTLDYYMSGQELKSAKNAFDEAVNDMIYGLSGKSEYEKAKILHDKLSRKTDYKQNTYDQSAYGALVKCQAVCAGYARAYQALLHKVGIDAWKVSGESYDPISKAKVAHAWNTVKIDGNWYYTDVTWDDQFKDERTDPMADEYDIYYAYFNITTAQMSEDHILDSEYYAKYAPICTATAANYFVKNGGIIGSFDAQDVASGFKNNKLKARFYVTGDRDAFTDAFFDNKEEVARYIGISGWRGCGIDTLGREVIIFYDGGAIFHDYSSLIKKDAPTCESDGMEAHYICLDCGAYFDANKAVKRESDLIIPALSHDYAPATCTTPQKCTRSGCGKTQGSALGHTASDFIADGDEHYRKCTVAVCGVTVLREAHTDLDQNNYCDKCNSVLQVASVTDGVTTPEMTPETNSVTTAPTTDKVTTELSNPQSSVVDITSTMSTSNEQPTDTSDSAPEKEKGGGAVIIVVIVAVGIGAVVVAGVILAKFKI